MVCIHLRNLPLSVFPLKGLMPTGTAAIAASESREAATLQHDCFLADYSTIFRFSKQ